MPKASPKTSEWLTRKEIIDRRLSDAGWRIVPENKFDPSKPLKTYGSLALAGPEKRRRLEAANSTM
jgi:hypothetical protein